MINLDQYKQLLALTNFQYEQARQLIHDLTQAGVFLPTQAERSFFDSQDNQKDRKDLNSLLRFRQRTIAYDLYYQVAALLSELETTPETTPEVHSLIKQMLLETKPYIWEQYLNEGIGESEFWATEFNLAMMYHLRTSFHGWVISSAEAVKIRSNDPSSTNQFIEMLDGRVVLESDLS